MKKILSVALCLISLCTGISPSHAVENGEDASGSGFVVPIVIQRSANAFGSCSGALIAPRIVVTAGHCVLDSNGLLTKNVFVGVAGSSLTSVSKADMVQSIEITSSFQNNSNGTVGDDDLAFLTLAKSQVLQLPVFLASEKQGVDLKNLRASLKVVGYGRYGDSSEETITTPKSMSGNFSPLNSIYTNSAYMSSTKADACQGDSGAPVLYITATQVTVVGIVTGVTLNLHCAKRESDGTYLTLFTLIGRYSNLAFASSVAVMNSQELLVNSQQSQISTANDQITSLKTSLDAAQRDLADSKSAIDTLNQSLADLQTKLDESNALVLNLKKQIPTSIVCAKGSILTKVTAVKPKCPSGFKIKNSSP